ncbi:HNH endonuclease signature motif containing protein [Pseudofrankia saprophytica]|uniref:HNH endonuclease signature motif containing protein n=1 Tax=Pseudofrankia saprophytica TaxID=298655 RepID=UPI000234D592|nr:HNH endonuclease signature motif containing protein [Pseudofrankia saprophytica]
MSDEKFDAEKISGAEKISMVGSGSAGLEVETAPLPELEAEICGWAGRIAAATCQMLRVLAAFDRRQGWSGLGMSTCAQWLSWRCGISVRTAQEHVAVARALEGLPAVRAAFAAGRLSYSKVRAVARVAEPASEPSWLAHALHCTAGQLERLVSRFHQLTADPSEQSAARKVSWRTGSDGLFRLSAVLTAEEGARLSVAIDAARAALDDVTPPPVDGEPGPVSVDGEIVAAPRDRRADADALVSLAEGFLCRPVPALMDPAHTLTVHVDAETLLVGQLVAGERLAAGRGDGGEGGASPPTADGAGRDCGSGLSAGERSARGKVVESAVASSRIATADRSTTGNRSAPDDQSATGNEFALDERSTSDDGIAAAGGFAAVIGNDPVSRLARGLLRCDAGPGIGLPRAVLSRLGCDVLVRALVQDDAANPLALGRRRRLPTQRLREAVYARDQGICQYPGCSHTRWLQAHHLRTWAADAGATDLENLTLLCSRHHRLIHDEGIALRRRDDGRIVATLPDGFEIVPAPRLDQRADLPDRRRHSGGDSDPVEQLIAATRHVDDDAIHTHGGGRLSWDDSLYVLLQHLQPSGAR